MAHRVLDVLGDGEFVFDRERLRFRPPTWGERWFGVVERDAIRLQHAEAFPLLDKLVEVGEAPERKRLADEYQAMVYANRKSVAALFAPEVGVLVAGFARRDAYLGCLAAALAAERYRRARGDWPPSLEALAPQFLGAVPLDPSDAQPLRYAKTDDGVVIYSTVADGKGKLFAPAAPSPPGEGTGVRLWNPDRRGKSD